MALIYRGPRARIGVYLCHCGVNIRATVDVEQVAEFARGLPRVEVVRDYPYICSDPGQELIRKDIREFGLNRVVVAACSPRMHEPTFQGVLEIEGLNPYLLEMANIREQCSWVHDQVEEATPKAAALVGAAVARARLLEPLEGREVEVLPRALVVGGGVAGIQAALDIATAGFKVYLVEREPSIGGHMAQLDKTFPTLDCSSCILTPKMVEVARHPNIELLTYAEVEEVEGFVGQFRIRIRRKPRFVDVDKCTGCMLCVDVCRLKGRLPDEFNLGLGRRGAIYIPFPQAVPLKAVIDPEHCLMLTREKCGKAPPCVEICPPGAIDFEQEDEFLELEVGVVVVATGYDLFDPREKPELGYGVYENVITGLEFERLSSASGPTGGKVEINGREPREVVFVQCVGSRDKSIGRPYCSRVCCMNSVKQSLLIKEKLPQAQITVFYIDLRSFGKGFEEFYDRVREEGVRFVRGNVSEIYRRGEKLIVRAEDTTLARPVEVEADMVVLAAGLGPHERARHVAELFKLPRTPDGFFAEAHPKLRPVDTVVDGVFLAGTSQGPKDVLDTVAYAKGAASGAVGLLSQGRVQAEVLTSRVDQSICRGCGFCVEACVYGAVELVTVNRFGHQVQVAEVNEALCKGCGACVAICPSGAIQQRAFSDEQVLAAIEALGEF